MTQERLVELISDFSNRRIAVLGDYFLDRYLDFDPDIADVSLETGKTANQVVRVRHSPGAAGNVVRNLHALGCGSIVTVGFSGDDGEGYELRQDLTAMGCNTEHLLVVPERMTPVYLKPQNIRVPGLEGESERYDTLNRQALPVGVEDKLISFLRALLSSPVVSGHPCPDTTGEPKIDALIVVDQVEERNCGAVTDRVRAVLAELAGDNPNITFWADSRTRISEYPCFIIKPNQHEAVAAVGGRRDDVTEPSVLDAGRSLSDRSGKPVFVTRAEHGMLVFEKDGCEPVCGVSVDGPIDPTGAGDSATASAVLALASGATPGEAALVANLTASITIQQIGTTGTATQAEVIDRFEVWSDQAR